MSKVILFGAGEVGYRTYYSLTDEFEVIAFADNDSNKQGRTLLGKEVIHPNEINNQIYDKIIISNIHKDSVHKQLTLELGVNAENILEFPIDLRFDNRLAYLKQIADEIYEKNISGNIAELGVYKGEFAKYINKLFFDRKFYLFDTFEGFSEKDTTIENANNYSNAIIGEYYNDDIELVLNKMTYKENCIVKKGYFPDSLDGLEDTFSFVSLDVDLYLPIYEGLKYFYPRMSSGGYILIHDYNSLRFTGVKDAVRKFCSEYNAKYMPLIDVSGSVVVLK